MCSHNLTNPLTFRFFLTKGFTVLGSFIVIILAIGLAWLAYYCQFKGGNEKCVQCMKTRERRRVALKELPDDMQFLRTRILALMDHTGLSEDDIPEDEVDNEEVAETKEIIGDLDEDDEVQA